MKRGADNRIVNNIVRTASNEVFAVSTFDFFTGQLHQPKRGGMPTYTHAADGYCDAFADKTLVFEYKEGANALETEVTCHAQVLWRSAYVVVAFVA